MRKYVKIAEGLKMREEKRFSNAFEYLELCIDRYEYRCINKNDIEWLKKTMKKTGSDEVLYKKIRNYCM